ncbi:MAG: MaoC/PaaZ C-terminal domain-containing protein [Thermodesulfobacteriota bacterium]|jgi:acyl dehydratase
MLYTAKGKFFEDWRIGVEFETGSRTISETDIVIFAGLSGDFNPLHINEEFAKKSVFGTRVAHGFLIHSISIGLINQTGYFDGTVMAQLGHNNISFSKRVVPGDTVKVKCKIIELRETSNRERGIITFEAVIVNQKGDVVAKSERVLMIKRRIE